MEALRLRVKDIDFQRREITVRHGKGGKDRVTLLPMSLMPALQEHLLRVRSLHHGDLEAGWGRVLMPYALARKYSNANREWAWQWVFPQQKRWRDRDSGSQGRHHLDPSVVQKAVKRAVAEAGPGHPHHSGVTGPQGREDHHDLYACAQLRSARGEQPCRYCVAARTCGSRTRKPRVLLGLPYLKPYAGTGFSPRARAPLGVVCGKPRGDWVWFSEPPNKELDGSQIRPQAASLDQCGCNQENFPKYPLRVLAT
jgi:hypothetical protein